MITVHTLPQAAHTVIRVTMPASQWSIREDEHDPGATEEAVLMRSPSGQWGTAYGWRKIWLIEVFEDADDDALASEIKPRVFQALGIREDA
jgi:hypothetical protein